MKYITRWALMRCMRQESLSEHTADTALLAHALCLIAQNITHTGADIRPDTVAAAALYHDAPEILTGDMPTPVKYKNEALRTAYKAVERESALAMADLLPPELHEIEGSYLTGSVLNDAERKLLKAATASSPPLSPSKKPIWPPCTAPKPIISLSTCCRAIRRTWMS